MGSSSRDKLLQTTAHLLATRGLGATSVREVSCASGVSQGSLYHFFPGGKDQLVEEAVAWVSGQFDAVLQHAGAAGSAVAQFDAFIEAWRRVLTDQDFRASCSVLAVATADARVDGAVVESAASNALRTWHGKLEATLRDSRISRRDARELAWALIAGIEGAVALARSQRDLQPLEATAKVLRKAIAQAVADAR